MNQEDKIESDGPEDGEKSKEEYPVCEDCGERHPQMPEGLKVVLQAVREAQEREREEEQEAHQNFFSLAMIGMHELAKAVVADPQNGKERAQAMRDAIMVLAGMSDAEEKKSSVTQIDLGNLDKEFFH